MMKNKKVKLIYRIDNWLCWKWNGTKENSIKAKFLDVLIRIVWLVEKWTKN